MDAIIGPWFLNHWQRAGRFHDPVHYVILRPSRDVAASRAVERDGPADLVDPEAVARMFGAFEDLGVFEAHVLDTTHHDITETVGAVERGMLAGQYVLCPEGRFDMERLALKFGIDPPS